MVAHEAGVLLPRRLLRRLVLGVHRGEEVIHRDLGVDRDPPVTREVDDQVGPKLALLTLHRLLLHEVDVLLHPRHLDRSPELHLAPLPTHGGSAEGAGELLRRVVELVLRRSELLELRLQAAEPLQPLLLHLTDLRLETLERIGHRLHELGHLLLPHLEVALRGLTKRLEALVGELHERLVRLLQDLGGDRVELFLHPLLLLDERGILLTLGSELGLEAGRRRGGLGRGAGVLLGGGASVGRRTGESCALEPPGDGGARDQRHEDDEERGGVGHDAWILTESAA